MKKIVFICLVVTFGFCKWEMFSSEDGTFIYDNDSGVTFRYFDTGSSMGFGKLNFHKNSVRSSIKRPKNKEHELPQTKPDNKFSKQQLQQLKDIILQNKNSMIKDVLK